MQFKIDVDTDNQSAIILAHAGGCMFSVVAHSYVDIDPKDGSIGLHSKSGERIGVLSGGLAIQFKKEFAKVRLNSKGSRSAKLNVPNINTPISQLSNQQKKALLSVLDELAQERMDADIVL
ncbi:hypothetical protein [Vibrio vulnificus]|uniref:hypothetical protein n=1 Tax=Vibrio vulnificus TaxID=672 RepID=UPI00102A1856|nr:hypothetical protein [Vibrio vulnificus]RZP89600.1 hypothetical protein D8T54_19670 [Vibrio vulnificus]RZR41902.1 hypothetical protein D8T58_20155 [Vibrio vulnificus]